MKCLYCKNTITNIRNRKYCDRKCFRNSNDKTWFKQNHKPLFEQNGEKNNMWKGDDVGYSALHKWIRKNLKKLPYCQVCGKERKWIDWANLSHEYKRIKNDWICMCRSCHAKYDKNLIIINEIIY